MDIKNIIDLTLNEDIGSGDITTSLIIAENAIAKFKLVTREEIILCGINITKYILNNYADNINITSHYQDGDNIPSNTIIMTGEGNAHTILRLERTILNIMQHLSGIASNVRRYVNLISHTKAKILDTRKTLPLLRNMQKYAIRLGGGANHRFGLYDGILIKDNHINIAGSIKNALELAKLNKPPLLKIEIECESLTQVKEALDYGADIIMLDNMTIAQLKEAVTMIKGKALTEASGGINLSNVVQVAETGVDYISIGRLTHSITAVDIGLDID